MKEDTHPPPLPPCCVRLRVKTPVIYSGALIIGRMFASDILGVCFACLFVCLFVWLLICLYVRGRLIFGGDYIQNFSVYLAACALSLARTVSKLFQRNFKGQRSKTFIQTQEI